MDEYVNPLQSLRQIIGRGQVSDHPSVNQGIDRRRLRPEQGTTTVPGATRKLVDKRTPNEAAGAGYGDEICSRWRNDALPMRVNGRKLLYSLVNRVWNRVRAHA